MRGDALWENGFGVIFPELEGESGFAEQAAVLERIAELDAHVVIPGHAGRSLAWLLQSIVRVGGLLTSARTRSAMLVMRSRCW